MQDGAGTGGLESEHGEAEKANGPNQAFSKETLIQAMEKTGWVQARAARMLGVTARQLGYALKKNGIEIKHL